MKRLIIAIIMFFGFTVPIDKDDAVIVDLQNQIEVLKGENEIMANKLMTEADKAKLDGINQGAIVTVWVGSEAITTGNTFDFFSGLILKQFYACELIFTITGPGNIQVVMVGNVATLAENLVFTSTSTTAILANDTGASVTITGIGLLLY